ncbi:hypothetical protein H9659_06480 [Sporosarcina sp. Sa3CUA8]|uniref:Uncharacterized protein n=1 Tax=Sporosarcina gallistercoris TaxID=2762245 RepID=A0ABR8PIH3_9BACL|nr:hypothetical protein [Sporosarcina gallistercoris]
MMTKNQVNEREQMEMLAIEKVVLQDHKVRKIDAAIGFYFIYPLVERLYSIYGKPSIDAIVLNKFNTLSAFGVVHRVLCFSLASAKTRSTVSFHFHRLL